MKNRQAIEPKYVEQMNEVAHSLDKLFNPNLNDKKVGFALLVFPLNEEPGRMNYLSNAQRDDMINSLKEFIARAEGQIEDNEQVQ